jgi:hypothetical protein
MSNRSANETDKDDAEREQRLAKLSGAMAIARLEHQVKELELKNEQKDAAIGPSLTRLNCVVSSILYAILIEVMRKSWFRL